MHTHTQTQKQSVYRRHLEGLLKSRQAQKFDKNPSCPQVGTEHPCSAADDWGYHYQKATAKGGKCINVPSICGQKKGEKSTSCFSHSKMDSRTFCTSCVLYLPVEFCILEGFFKWMEPSLFGLEKEHTLPELGKGSVMPREHNMLTA